MRALSILIMALLLLGGSPALGQGLMLEEEPSTEHTGTGVSFLLLTLATLAYGAKSYNDSRDDLDRADALFAQYQAAGAGNVSVLRVAASDALNDARVNEERANAALYLGILFALTSYYSFNPEDLPDISLALTPRGVLYNYRF